MPGVLAWVLLVLVELSSAQQPPLLPQPEPTFATPDYPVVLAANSLPTERLDAAIEAYLRGDLDLARDAFLALVADPGLKQSHPQVRREAQVFLGSLDYNLGDRRAAHRTFLSILLEDPEFELDPFAHPPDLLAFYDSVRVEALAMRPRPVEPVEPRERLNPLLIVVPGGLQLYNDQRRYGLLVLGGVTAAAATSLVAGIQLRRMDTDSETAQIEVTTESDKLLAERLKLTANVSGFAGIVLWSATFLHGALMSPRRDGTETVSVVGPNIVVRW
jgi:hypothetical protein